MLAIGAAGAFASAGHFACEAQHIPDLWPAVARFFVVLVLAAAGAAALIIVVAESHIRRNANA